MGKDLSVTAFAAGVLAAFVGFAGSFAIVVQGLYGVGANAAEAASGLMVLAVSMGLCAIFLALKTRMPISVAWSTPGAAFLATLTPVEGGFPVAVGAFIITALLIIVAGLWKSFGRVISAIPTPLASAMLAGVLLPLCLAPFEAIAEIPQVGLPIILVWLVVARFKRVLAVPAAVVVAGVLFGWTGLFSLASAPFGAHAVNLAAITTAICAGEEAHPDPGKRYWAAVIGGITYIIFGLTAGAAIGFISISPPILIAAVAGLALFGALSASLVTAMSSETDREAALITFLVTASGISFFGIGGVFWGLLAGGAMYLWDPRKSKSEFNDPAL